MRIILVINTCEIHSRSVLVPEPPDDDLDVDVAEAGDVDQLAVGVVHSHGDL